MNKYISAAFLLLFSSSFIHPQAAMDLGFVVCDNLHNYKILYYGHDPSATAGIDPQLWESDLPPFPPPGPLEVRWDLMLYAGEPLSSYRDYRHANIPYYGNQQYTLWWQIAAGATYLKVLYSLPRECDSMQIQDEMGGVLFNSGHLTGNGSFIINYASVLSRAVVKVHYNLALSWLYAAVDIPIVVTDNINGLRNMNLGVDRWTTVGLDGYYGESPRNMPPAGTFESLFDFSPYGGGNILSWVDYRHAPGFPFTGSVQHRLRYQLGTGATSLSIGYQMPEYATLQIQDTLGGTIINSPVLSGYGTYVVTAPSLNALNFNVTYTNALPVELTSFTGTQEGMSIGLNWITGSETNNRGFDIERKYSGQEYWEKIAFVQGKGTTSEITRYYFRDKDVNTGFYLYRLKQIDYDGSFEYSDIVKVTLSLPLEFSLEQNYPNPFNPSTKIKYSIAEEGLVNLSVYDLMGQKAAELKNEVLLPGYYETEFDASSLSSGIYVYRLSSSGKVLSRKMVVLK